MDQDLYYNEIADKPFVCGLMYFDERTGASPVLLFCTKKRRSLLQLHLFPDKYIIMEDYLDNSLAKA